MSMLFGTLTVKHNGSEQTYPLTKTTVGIGRSANSDIVLHDERISREHAQILCEPGNLSIVDLGSANGILVDGFRPSAHDPIQLHDGSQIEIGGVLLIVHVIPEIAPVVQPQEPGSEGTQNLKNQTQTNLPVLQTSTEEGPDAAQATEAYVSPSPTTFPELPVVGSEEAPGDVSQTEAQIEAAEPPVASAQPIEAEAPQQRAPTVPPQISEGSSARAQKDAKPITMVLRNADLEVACKGIERPVDVMVDVVNSSNITAEIFLSIEKLDKSWYTISPESVPLFPHTYTDGVSKNVFHIQFHPAKSHTSTAGEHSYIIVATSTDFAEVASLSDKIRIKPFYEYQSRLDPRKKINGRYRGKYKLKVKNNSNAVLPVQIKWEDDENALDIDFDDDTFDLQPGEEHTVRATIGARRRWPFGKPISYGFTTIVSPQVKDVEVQEQRHEATLVLHRLPVWLLFLPLLLLPLLLLLIPSNFWFPPDPRQTAHVTRGNLSLPIDLPAHPIAKETIVLAFAREGAIETIKVKPGMMVRQNEQIAQLRYYEQLLAIRRAEDELEGAIEDLRLAREQQSRSVEQAQIDLEQAQDTAARLQPGGPNDPTRKVQQQMADAQRALAQAQREANIVSATGSGDKIAAEAALTKAVEALQEAEQLKNKAYWENKWVEEHGTDPNAANGKTVETGEDTETTTRQVPPKLNDVQKLAFKDALATATRQVDEAQRAVDEANRALERARAAEIAQNGQSNDAIQAAQQQIDVLTQQSQDENTALSDAQRAVQQAQLKVEIASTSGLEPYLKAVDTAQKALDDARAQLENRKLIAPRNGLVVAVMASEGTSVQTSTPVVALAVPGELELAITPAPEQLPLLREGMPVSITVGITSTNQTTVISGTIRQLPLPVASGAAQQPDQTVRVAFTKPFTLPIDASARVHIEVEQRNNVLVVPPPFVYKDGDARYLLIKAPTCPFWGLRRSLCERRVDVRVGLETPKGVEIQAAYGSLQGQTASATSLTEPPTATPTQQNQPTATPISPEVLANDLQGAEVLGP